MEKLFIDEVVLETGHFKVAQDWEVPIPAFFIISCKRNIRSVGEFSDTEAQEFGPLLKKIREGMKEALGIEEVFQKVRENVELMRKFFSELYMKTNG